MEVVDKHTVAKRLSIAHVEYVVVAILLLVSGAPCVMKTPWEDLSQIVVSVVFTAILFLRGKRLIQARMLGIFTAFILILLLQCIDFDFWPFNTMIGFLLRMQIAYVTVRIVADFPTRYTETLYYLCLISFPFHLLALLYYFTGIDLIRLMSPINSMISPWVGFNVVVHQYSFYGGGTDLISAYRNSACFWEPGIFAAYILLAIVFLGYRRQAFTIMRYRRILSVLIVALLTTMSTAGYLVLPFCLIFQLKNISFGKKFFHAMPKYMLLWLILGFFVFQIGFVGEKLRRHIDSINTREVSSEIDWRLGRFGTLVYDVERYISVRPLTGWGLNHRTRHFFDSGAFIYKQGNGLSDFVVKFGIVGLAIFLYGAWKSVYSMTNYRWLPSALFLVFLMAILNGQRLLNFPVFLSLMFLQFPKFTKNGLMTVCYSARRPFKGIAPASCFRTHNLVVRS